MDDASMPIGTANGIHLTLDGLLYQAEDAELTRRGRDGS